MFGSSYLTAQNKSPNWLQGNHDEYQTNRIDLYQSTPIFNISFSGSPSIYFDRNLVLADASQNLLITNYALYDGEKFPQFSEFVLNKIDLISGKMTKLNLDTARPAFHFDSVSRAVMSPQGVYYFALSRQQVGLNFVFTYNLTGGVNNLGFVNYYPIPYGKQVDGLAIVDNTLFVSNVVSLTAFNLDMTIKYSLTTGLMYGHASNLITTIEHGRNVLYYGAQNVIYRLDIPNFHLVNYQFPLDYIVKSISYMGNGILMVVVSDSDMMDDRIYTVNVVNRISLKLQNNDPDLGQLSQCSNSLNIQAPANPLVTYSVLVCGKYQGTDSDKNVIGISFDATTQIPSFSVIWHLPFQSSNLHLTSTHNERHFLLAHDNGYIVMDLVSGTMILSKPSLIANSSCKIITAMNGKFYSVCSDSSTLRISSQFIY